MKTITSYLKVLLLATSIVTFSSCGKDDSSTPTNTNNNGNNNNPPTQVEGEYVGKWTSGNAELPTENMRNKYERFDLTLTANNQYTWLWKGKVSDDDLEFKGTISHDVTSSKHTSGSRFWQIAVRVTTINGQSFPGGWIGIYTYENPTTLKLNVEPDVQSWTKWPAADEGLGSGQEGEKSVYVFTKVE